jgi:hypothetical protein
MALGDALYHLPPDLPPPPGWDSIPGAPSIIAAASSRSAVVKPSVKVERADATDALAVSALCGDELDRYRPIAARS